MGSNRQLTNLGLALSAGWVVGCSQSIDIAGPTTDPPDPSSVEFAWRGAVDIGDQIEIKNIAGVVTASRAVGAEVEIEATKQGTRDDPAEVRIEVVRHAGGVTICAVYPTRPGHPQNECRPGDAGHRNSHDHDVEVTFTVRVPAGVEFVGKTVTGNVVADELESDVIVRSVAGNIEVTTTGRAEASTVAGSIVARLEAVEWGRDLTFASVAGDVEVEIPPSTNADVTASAPNGRIASDFPLTQTAFGRMEGTIGRGGPELSLSTISGDIRLRAIPE